MAFNKLTAGSLKKKGPAKLCDGGGLWLYITSTHSKRWVFRYRFEGRDHEVGLGSLETVSLADARIKATEYRALKQQGINPVHHKKAQQHKNAKLTTWTFDKCAKAYIEAHCPSWRNEKHISQWRNTIEQYCSPVFGSLQVGQVNTALVMQVLEPLWQTRTETASRVRGRIENILSWAIVRGYRDGPNPALWRGHLSMLLPQRNKVQKPNHHSALPYHQIADFMSKLSEKTSLSALALQFTILTAARTGEVIGSSWDEITDGIWTIPAERMKTGIEHHIPLSRQAMKVLEQLPDKTGWIFPSVQHGKHISNMAMLKFLKTDMNHRDLTVHGFRSSFRDWAAEQTSFPRELAEAALAHRLKDKAEAAYQRGDMLEKRRKMMQAWADYCTIQKSNVVRLHGQ